MPTPKISNPDVTGLINSSAIQSVVRPANPKTQKRPWTQHKNPLRNKAVLFRLNPYAKTLRRQELRALHVLPSRFCFRSADGLPCVVRQERTKKNKDKKPKKKAHAASNAFLSTLFAP